MKQQDLTLTLGFSPCPNDTFMFDAMVHGKIDTEGLRFKVMMEDVETLNQLALKEEPDVTKLSYATYARVMEKYILLNSGSALGEGVGPLVISKSGLQNNHPSIRTLQSEIRNYSIAIPGKNTTANFLFSIFFPESKNKTEMVFSEIEEAVLSGKADAGVIIHENRFTYEQKGLKKICDLGELWKQETNQPIPLGGIAIKRNLSEGIKQKVDRVMRRSVEYAFANPGSGHDYIRQHAQEMDEVVIKKHIDLYVNDYSIDLGEKGKNAIAFLFKKAVETGMIAASVNDLFINQLVQQPIQ
jgi:1,4-dihydroxy-6-naphthoate synthase